MATIKGKWVFNETLTWVEIIEHINFSCPSYSEYPLLYGFRMSTATNVLYYWKDANSSGFEAYKKSGGWLNQAYRTVDFGTTEQTVSDTFLTWITDNATPEAPPTPTDEVTIEYNGSVIASLKAGQSATLHCMGDNVKMLTDIEVNVPMMASGGAVETISFTIGSKSYEAVSGMNWGEWVYSSYGPSDGFVSGNNVSISAYGTYVIGVTTRTVITPNGSYEPEHSGGSW